VNSSVFNVFLNSTRDVEEQIATSKLFQTQIAAAEKPLASMMARRVREITKTAEDEERSRCMTCVNCVCVQVAAFSLVNNFITQVLCATVMLNLSVRRPGHTLSFFLFRLYIYRLIQSFTMIHIFQSAKDGIDG